MALVADSPSFATAFYELRRWTEEIERLHEQELAGLREDVRRFREQAWQQEKELARVREQAKDQDQEFVPKPSAAPSAKKAPKGPQQPSAAPPGAHSSEDSKKGAAKKEKKKANQAAEKDEILGSFIGVWKASFDTFSVIKCEEFEHDVTVPGDFEVQIGDAVEFEAYRIAGEGRVKGRKPRDPPNAKDQAGVVGQFVGVVKKYSHDQGFGFITCSGLVNEDGREDAYVHRNQVGDFDMQPGQMVLFEAFWNKGRLQAQHLRHPPQDSQEGASNDESLGDFIGVVKSFNPTKGFGFITCDALQGDDGSDIYVHKSEVGDFDMQAGAPVLFEAFWIKGRLNARRLQAPPESSKDDVGDELIGKFAGVIKSTPTKEKSYGFIACDELQKDVFYTRKGVGNFDAQVGSPVLFEAYWHQGKLRGRHLCAPVLQESWNKSSWQESWDKSSEKVLGDYVGVIKNLRADKGFGFITCHDLWNESKQPQVFVGQREIGDFDFQAGAPVLFEALWRGGPGDWRLQGRKLRVPPEIHGVAETLRLHAGNWREEAPGDYMALLKSEDSAENQGRKGAGSAENQSLGSGFRGVVKAFWPDKGYGFITCEELQDVPQNHGHKDIFLHRKHVGQDCHIEAGLAVQFDAFMERGQICSRSLVEITSDSDADSGGPSKRRKQD